MINLEVLEDRSLPSASPMASIVQQGGVLAITGQNNTENVITIDPVGTQVRVTLNGQQSFFNNVTSLVITGGDKADDISNNTAVASTILGNGGNDMILGGSGNDVIVAGKGKDTVYDLLAVNTIVANDDNSADTVFTNAQSAAFVDNKDQLVSFFAPGRTPGAGAVSLEQGVLYIAPSNNGTQVNLNEVNGQIVLNYDFGDGNGLQTQTFNKKDVDYIAYFGGTGNDTYINNTTVNDVAYGSAGNDTLLGGYGDFNLLKGSGGNDYLQGRAKRSDLSGNGGADVLVGNDGFTTFRTDALDQIFGQEKRDLVVAS